MSGLEALQKQFKAKYGKDKFVNLAVAGGAGSNAKAKLATDLQNGNPPDSFQGHAGAELTDYIRKGQIAPVNDVFKSLGGELPEGPAGPADRQGQHLLGSLQHLPRQRGLDRSRRAEEGWGERHAEGY